MKPGRGVRIIVRIVDEEIGDELLERAPRSASHPGSKPGDLPEVVIEDRLFRDGKQVAALRHRERNQIISGLREFLIDTALGHIRQIAKVAEANPMLGLIVVRLWSQRGARRRPLELRRSPG